MRIPPDEARVFFRSQLREARAEALRDGEAFDRIIQAIERLGAYVTRGNGSGLGSYREPLTALVEGVSPRETKTFADLFECVRLARNEAVHQGAFARHLARNAARVALFLEEALSVELKKVEHYMVDRPVCAMPWQTLSLVRQTMLANSFSYLPVLYENRWHLISDGALVHFLHGRRDPNVAVQLELADAVKEDEKLLVPADVIKSGESIRDAIKLLKKEQPILVADSPGAAHLDGIITLFDLL